MKIIRKKVYVQTPKIIESYESSDGFEYASRAECESHERTLGFRGVKVVETAINDLNDFYDERPMTLYKVESEADWNVLVERIWFYRQNKRVYPGPGFYVAVQMNGGDYDDEYEIYEYDEYMNNLHHYYNEFCNRMEDAFQDLNI